MTHDSILEKRTNVPGKRNVMYSVTRVKLGITGKTHVKIQVKPAL